MHLVTKQYFDRMYTVDKIEHFAFEKKKDTEKFVKKVKENEPSTDQPFFKPYFQYIVEEIKVK